MVFGLEVGVGLLFGIVAVVGALLLAARPELRHPKKRVDQQAQHALDYHASKRNVRPRKKPRKGEIGSPERPTRACPKSLRFSPAECLVPGNLLPVYDEAECQSWVVSGHLCDSILTLVGANWARKASPQRATYHRRTV